MSAGQTIILGGPSSKFQAHNLIEAAPVGSILNVKPPLRTLSQNDLLWALLSKVSMAKPEGRALTPDVWKSLFLHALDHAQRFEMALDGKGMVPVGFRSSRLTKAQFSDLIETIHEYAARHSVELGEAA